MTSGTTLGEHLRMVASAIMFYVAVYYKNKTIMKVADSNIKISVDLTLFCS